MTEAEWLNCTDPHKMLRSANMRLRGLANRQHDTPRLEHFRLFACACCRRIWSLLQQDDQEAVQLLEDYAQSRGSKELLRARKRHRPASYRASNEMSRVSREHPGNEPLLLTAWAKNLATSAVWEATAKKPTSAANAHLSVARAIGSLQRAVELERHREYASGGSGTIDWQIVSEDELAIQATLLRCIFGNSFRPATISSTWRTPTVLSLAQRAYDDRHLPSGHLDPLLLAGLSDALEQVGAADEILGHLRQEGAVHVRGCWVVDCLLEKK